MIITYQKLFSVLPYWLIGKNLDAIALIQSRSFLQEEFLELADQAPKIYEEPLVCLDVYSQGSVVYLRSLAVIDRNIISLELQRTTYFCAANYQEICNSRVIPLWVNLPRGNGPRPAILGIQSPYLPLLNWDNSLSQLIEPD